MSRKTQTNPPWAENLVHKYCDEIARVARKHDLPLPLFDGPCEIDPRSELGSGIYGVVYLTDDLGCVFKATTDSSEAHFIATAIKLRKERGIDPAGIVDYRAVFALPEKHGGEEIFITWREKAVSVGLPESVAKSDRSMLKFIQAMAAFYEASEGNPPHDAGAFWLAVEQQQHTSEQAYWNWLKERVALANRMIDGKEGLSKSEMANRLYYAYVAAEEMEKSGPDGRHVGQALRIFQENGLLICDLHANNVGVVERDGKRKWVLTDCGHSLCLSEDLRDIGIPILKG